MGVSPLLLAAPIDRKKNTAWLTLIAASRMIPSRIPVDHRLRYSDLVVEAGAAGVAVLSVFVAAPLSAPLLSEVAELLSALLFPSCDLLGGSGLGGIVRGVKTGSLEMRPRAAEIKPLHFALANRAFLASAAEKV